MRILLVKVLRHLVNALPHALHSLLASTAEEVRIGFHVDVEIGVLFLQVIYELGAARCIVGELGLGVGWFGHVGKGFFLVWRSVFTGVENGDADPQISDDGMRGEHWELLKIKMV